MSDIVESPVDRVNRKNTHQYWKNLKRRRDGSMIQVATVDSKDKNETTRPRIYIPPCLPRQYKYYRQISKQYPGLNLNVQYLPHEDITEEFVQSLWAIPGILALEMEQPPGAGDDVMSMRGPEFIVPGGRFNELYYWDSYFTSLGLLDIGRTDLVKQIIRNFIFQINHYGKILNVNRSYYLCRSQHHF